METESFESLGVLDTAGSVFAGASLSVSMTLSLFFFVLCESLSSNAALAEIKAAVLAVVRMMARSSLMSRSKAACSFALARELMEASSQPPPLYIAYI